MRYSTPAVVILLGVILLISAGVRIYGLDRQSLWYDEFFSWNLGKEDTVSAVLKQVADTDVHPPAYSILTHFVEHYIGDSEVDLRLPSAIAGVLSILVMFLVGRTLFSTQEGLIAAAIMGVAWTPIYYSQEARSNMIMLLTMTLATYLWLKLLMQLHQKSTISIPMAAGYVILAVFACYLHYFSILFIGLQGVLSFLLFYRRWSQLRFLLITYFLIGLFYLPWVLPFWRQRWTISHNYNWVLPPNLQSLGDFLVFAYAPDPNLTGGIVAFISIVLGYKIITYFRHRSSQSAETEASALPISPDLLVWLWLVVPFAATYVASLVWTPMLVGRNLIFLLPAAYLLLARAITALRIRPGLHLLIGGLLAAWFAYGLIFVWQYYDTYDKEQMREVAQYIMADDDPTGKRLVVSNIAIPDALDYYFIKSKSDIRADQILDNENTNSRVVGYVENVSPDRVWFVNEKWGWDSTELFDYLQSNFQLVDHETFIALDVYLFEST